MRALGACMEGACVAGGVRDGGVRGRRDGHCSGPYASYWNAFLFCNFFAENYMKMKEFGPGAPLDPPLVGILCWSVETQLSHNLLIIC